MANVWVLCADLIFTTKIRGTAAELGVATTLVANGSGAMPPSAPALVLIDLSAPGTSEEDLRRLREAYPGPVRLVAFGSHVEVDRLREARAAGCDLVLPRSEFSRQLPILLAEVRAST